MRKQKPLIELKPACDRVRVLCEAGELIPPSACLDVLDALEITEKLLEQARISLWSCSLD